jgi:Transcriptional activator, adenine-specific DNA methyltransferase
LFPSSASAATQAFNIFGLCLAGTSHVVRVRNILQTAADHLRAFAHGERFSTILADPPWQFTNRTGKMAPEHRRLRRYGTMTLAEIMALPVAEVAAERAHLYLWVPNALLPEGLEVMRRWGFAYKTNLVWYKIRKDGGPDRRGVGFYFRNVTELVLFGVRGRDVRTREAGRTLPNLFATCKREHSRKPDEHYALIEACSRPPFLELFARHTRAGWWQWGDEAPEVTSAAAAVDAADDPVAQSD